MTDQIKSLDELNAVPVTTEKDHVRLPEEARPMVQCVVVDIEWATPQTADTLLAPVLRHG